MSTDNLQTALHYLRAVIVARLQCASPEALEQTVNGTAYYADDSPFAQFIEAHAPSFEEYIVLLLALSPNVLPTFLSDIISTYLPTGGDFPAFGGVRGNGHRGVIPTGETAQFILAGDNLVNRMLVQRMLGSEHWFARKHILWPEAVREGEPTMSGRLILAPEVVELLTVGTVSKPRFCSEFPAEHLQTEMDWSDLVLNQDTRKQIRDIENWNLHKDTLLHDWGMGRRMKPGYRALFYGPPGTGKTLTATLLGQQTGREVFRVDLSRVVSKYIGETEKNLARLFDKAENKQWILFFDEADALFSKRTDVRDSLDRHANQEVAYLLQRIETYNGLVILATNQRSNIDDAFVRRFQAIVHFPMPGPVEREAIWCKSFPPQIELASDVDWREIAGRHELSGASILNVSHYCALEVLASGTHRLDQQQLEAAILREYVKEGKII
ncbi:ATP-binding protein [Pseudomonas sp. NPDC090755]|uniref:ATP-binding protein n=1 Tax=Pseudomonas sp. NPDC090755 TaxID=3364481 RepID=UPI00383ABDAB